MKNKICILGGSEQQLPLLEEAKRRGYKVYLLDQDPDCVGRVKADIFFEINIHENNYEEISTKVETINPSIVSTIASDVAIRTVNKLVDDFHLPGNSYQTALWTTDKWEMKEKLHEANLPTTKAILVESIEELKSQEIEFPVMVKASDRSGGRGITYVEQQKYLESAVNDAINNSFSKKVLIEEYFEGKQYSIETLSSDQEHHIIAITEEFYTGRPFFVERQHLVPARINTEASERISKLVNKILDVFHVKTGASHIELRINEDGALNIIEIASRMGGDFRHELIELSKGINYVGLLMNALEGEKINLQAAKDFHALIQWACKAEDVEKLNRYAKKYDNEVVRNGLNINSQNHSNIAQNGTDRLGYLLYTTPSYEKICKLII